MVSLDANVVRSDGAQMNFRGNLERFADLDVLAIVIADLNIEDASLAANLCASALSIC